MATLDAMLSERLAGLAESHLLRGLRELEPADGTRWVTGREGRRLLNFSSNDYLGLAWHPRVCRALAEAVEVWGAGAGASRLVCGSLGAHHALEEDLARWKRLPAALTFSSGYATALGVVPALVGPGDYVILDRLAHASLVDAARLSGAKLRVFRHNDPADLERMLGWAASRTGEKAGESGAGGRGQVLILTESVFSMDGDVAPLRELVELKERYGAWLWVDEAHATGVLGAEGRGALEAAGLAGKVEVSMGTLGKALGSAGGFIAGSAVLRDYLVNRARSFVFSTAPPPAVAMAARAGLAVLTGDEGAERMRRLWELLARLHRGLGELGWEMPAPTSAILPLRVGAEDAATRLGGAMREEGLLVPGIRYPTVPRGEARLRLTVSAAHEPGDVDQLLEGLRRAMDRTGIRPGP